MDRGFAGVYRDIYNARGGGCGAVGTYGRRDLYQCSFVVFSFRKTKNTLRLSYVFFAAAAECVSLGMAIGLSFFAAYLLVGISMIFCVSVLTAYRKELKSELRWRIFGKGKQDDIREQE